MNVFQRYNTWMRQAGVLYLLMTLTMPLVAQQLCVDQGVQASSPTTQFVLDDLVATDSKTGLMWQRCFAGASGSDCSAGELQRMSWAAAHQYVEQVNAQGVAGFNDWRLPNVRELSSIVELRCVEPALNVAIFPNAPSERTWSASPYQFYPHYSWFVDFQFFDVTYQERYREHVILLVRAGN